MLTGKNIFIVGASGGIGNSVAMECHAQGANIIAGYCNNEQELENLKKNIEDIICVPIDLACEKSIVDGVANILQVHHQIHGLVNCAGIHVAGPLISMTHAEITKQLQINVTGAIFLTQQIVKNMVRKREGCILHLGSVAAHRMVRGHSVYSATKAALEGFTKALAAEVAPRGIRVNCILPGPVMTKMLQKTIEDTGDTPQERIPLKRLITTAEIAKLVCFLLSNEALAITGTVIPVDGGYLLW